MATKRILLNKQDEQTLRIASLEGKTLYDLQIELTNQQQQMLDSIYNATVTSVEPSLEAAFVDTGSGRNGFLPLKEVAQQFHADKSINPRQSVSIQDVLKPGQKILVQIKKEERGHKGAALSTYITLAGCYLVLMPHNPKAGGISRQIEGDEREQIRSILNQLTAPDDAGIIVRTAGLGRSLEELQCDLDALINLSNAIEQASKENDSPHLLHQESDPAIRAIRDHMRADVEEVLIDNEEIYEKILGYIQRVKPGFADKIKLYHGASPLFSLFEIEKQIETAYKRKVRLSSGGEIVIDRTEALIAIDVNSAQSTKGVDIEETALLTNLEAADEVARQLRIRDLGGLFVLDFIDMGIESHNKEVEDRLKNALKLDRARTQITRISRFGLLEMSRQRLRTSLSESSQIVCPRCHGQGTIRNIRAQAQTIIHLIEEEAAKGKTSRLSIQLPIEEATYMANELRHTLDEIEVKNNISIIIIPNPHFNSPQYEIEKSFGKKGQGKQQASYELIKTPKMVFAQDDKNLDRPINKQEPAVKNIVPEMPKETIQKIHKIKTSTTTPWTFVKQVFVSLFSDNEQTTQKKKELPQRNSQNRQRPIRDSEKTRERTDNRPEGDRDNRVKFDDGRRRRTKLNDRRRPRQSTGDSKPSSYVERRPPQSRRYEEPNKNRFIEQPVQQPERAQKQDAEIEQKRNLEIEISAPPIAKEQNALPQNSVVTIEPQVQKQEKPKATFGYDEHKYEAISTVSQHVSENNDLVQIETQKE